MECGDSFAALAVSLRAKRLTQTSQTSESGEGIVIADDETGEVRALWSGLRNAIERWRILCWQYMRTTLVTHGNSLLAPTVGLMLCVPKFLSGAMSLGEVTQAAAAFVTVQGACNWLVDNFQRMADWRSAANRVAIMLLALDELNERESLARSPDASPASMIAHAPETG